MAQLFPFPVPAIPTPQQAHQQEIENLEETLAALRQFTSMARRTVHRIIARQTTERMKNDPTISRINTTPINANSLKSG